MRVIIRNCLPEQGNLKVGVPQWSVLGLLLFLLYINDITDNTQSLSRLFADDTSLLYSSNFKYIFNMTMPFTIVGTGDT
jgi:hypothetical protein